MIKNNYIHTILVVLLGLGAKRGTQPVFADELALDIGERAKSFCETVKNSGSKTKLNAGAEIEVGFLAKIVSILG